MVGRLSPGRELGCQDSNNLIRQINHHSAKLLALTLNSRLREYRLTINRIRHQLTTQELVCDRKTLRQCKTFEVF